MVVGLRIAAAVLVLIGVVSLAVPVRTFRHDCGSPIDRAEPTAAQAWNDVYGVRGAVEHCPGLLRMRRVVGGVAVLGALVAIALPAFVAARRPGGGRLTWPQWLVVLRASAVGLLLVAVGALALPVHGGLAYCGSPLAPAALDSGAYAVDIGAMRTRRCVSAVRARRVVGGGAAVGGLAALALPAVVGRRRATAREG